LTLYYDQFFLLPQHPKAANLYITNTPPTQKIIAYAILLPVNQCFERLFHFQKKRIIQITLEHALLNAVAIVSQNLRKPVTPPVIYDVI